MILLAFFIGIVVGLALTYPVLLVALWSKPRAERYIAQKQSSFKARGKVIDLKDDDLEDWLNDLEEKRLQAEE